MPYVIIEQTKGIVQETKVEIILPKGQEFDQGNGHVWSHGKYYCIFDVGGQLARVDAACVRWRSEEGHLHEVNLPEIPPVTDDFMPATGGGSPHSSIPASQRNYDGDNFGSGEW